MIDPLVRFYTIRRGDTFIGERFRFKSSLGTTFWDNFVVKSQLRASLDGAVVYQFDLSSAAVTDEDGVGVLTVDLTAPPASSATLPIGTLIGDLEVTSDRLPKATLVVYRAAVLGDVTR